MSSQREREESQLPAPAKRSPDDRSEHPAQGDEAERLADAAEKGRARLWRTAASEDAGPLVAANPAVADSLRRYWQSNIRIMLVLLAVWGTASLGCGVLLAGVLNQYRLGGFPLGFWFAQQGSILVFVLLILAYALLLNRLDRRHHREIVALRENAVGTADREVSSEK